MEKEKKENSITDNKDMDKRVLVVGKLKGKKETKPKKAKTTTKTKTTAKVAKTSKPKPTAKKETKSKTTISKKAEKPKTAVAKKKNISKVSVKEEKTTNKQQTTKSKVTKNTGAKKVTEKKGTPKKSETGKIKIVEKIENLVKTKSSKPKKTKTKRAMEQVNVLRVNINSKEFKTIARDAIVFILVVVLAISLIYIGNAGKENVSNKILYSSLSKDIKIDELTNKGTSTAEAIQILKQENPEIQGWIKIDGTNVNYPLLQGRDNKYYLTHNFKNEKTSYGSIFINTESDLNNDKANVIIYGHDMKDGQMFSDLIKYADKEYYDEHKTIKITTDQAETEYTIVNVFKSKVFYKDEKNVFRFYQYYNLENEKQFNEYVSNCKKLQLYDTGVEAKYGDQLVTLITCEYSTENGRMVVVAKKN